jgi:hypothetical protein
LEDPGIDGEIIFRWIFWMEGGTNWIDLAQERDRWWAFVNSIMDICIP